MCTLNGSDLNRRSQRHKLAQPGRRVGNNTALGRLALPESPSVATGNNPSTTQVPQMGRMGKLTPGGYVATPRKQSAQSIQNNQIRSNYLCISATLSTATQQLRSTTHVKHFRLMCHSRMSVFSALASAQVGSWSGLDFSRVVMHNLSTARGPGLWPINKRAQRCKQEAKNCKRALSP